MTTHPSNQQQACSDRHELPAPAAQKRRRRGRRPPPIDTRQILTPQQLEELWAAYQADRSNLRLRNRLVEHYLPWIRHTAAALAHRLHLGDEENAVGEVLAALVGSIIPDYDGTGSFHRWARICTRRKLLDILRGERRAEAIFADLPPGASAIPLPELLPDREQRNCDLKFLEITAELSHQQATVLWLRLYRGLSVAAVARLLKVSPTTVKSWTQKAATELQNTWSGCPSDALHAY